MIRLRSSCALAAAALLLGWGAAPAAADAGASERVRAHVEFLASDRLMGREPGSVGFAIAADYVAEQFRALGLKPAGPNGSWYQQVPLRRASHAAPPRVRLTVGGKTTELVNAVDFALQPSLGERTRSIEAPVVFVGHGLSEPALRMDDYSGLDVRGKIVVALAGVPNGVPIELATHLTTTKDEIAAARGAIGFVEIPEVSWSGRPWSFGLLSAPRLDWVDAAGNHGKRGARARLALSTRAAQLLFQGAPTSLDSIWSQARASNVVRGFALPAHISIASESEWHDFSSPQVLAVLPGQELANEHLLLTGHLDHLGVNGAARPGEDAIFNGALDNAAGVATLIEAARSFAAAERPRRSIIFLASTGEERGLIGADYFATHPTVPLQQIVGTLTFDMPLLLYDFTDVVVLGGENSDIGKIAVAAGRSMGIAVSADPMPQEALFVRSDNYRFVLHGIPSVFLMTGHANGGKKAWDHYLTKVYHRPNDDLTQAIDWRSGARFSELNFRIGRALADQPERPRWYQGDYFGDRFAPGQPRADR